MSKKTPLLHIGIALAAFACLWQAKAVAAPIAATLIDKDFDSAVGKFIVKRVCKRIDASVEQTEKLTAIVSQSRDDTRPFREQLRHGLLDLSTMMAANETTDDQIRAKVTELRTIHEKIGDARVETMLKARKILTPDQRQKINKRVTDLITGEATPMMNLRTCME